MKSFLTFTLAAGVAITTTSVVQAAGVAKGAPNTDRTASTQSQAPMSVGTLSGLVLDRSALNRELNRLSTLLQTVDGDEENGAAKRNVTRKLEGNWTF